MDYTFVTKAINQAVKFRVEKSINLGSKATWSAGDHKEMIATVLELAAAQSPGHAEWLEIAGMVYNHSAHAQKLEKQFAGTGHFQRASKDARSLDDIMKELEG